MLEYIVKFLMIFGVPILLCVFAIIILVNIIIVPQIKTVKAQRVNAENVAVKDKRKTVRSSVNGYLIEYYITVLLNGENMELKCSKSIYKKVNCEDIGTISYKPSVELVTSFQITKKSGNKTKGKVETPYSFTGNGVYRR